MIAGLVPSQRYYHSARAHSIYTGGSTLKLIASSDDKFCGGPTLSSGEQMLQSLYDKIALGDSEDGR